MASITSTQSYIPGIFATDELAEAAIAELRRLGVSGTDILVVTRAGAHGEQVKRIMIRFGARDVPPPRYPTLDEEFETEPPGD